VPVAIIGTDAVDPRRGGLGLRQIVLRCGVPFDLDLEGRRDDRAIADEIARRVAGLLPAPRRGAYADATVPAGSGAPGG